jgi:hypothetical protein
VCSPNHTSRLAGTLMLSLRSTFTSTPSGAYPHIVARAGAETKTISDPYNELNRKGGGAAATRTATPSIHHTLNPIVLPVASEAEELRAIQLLTAHATIKFGITPNVHSSLSSLAGCLFPSKSSFTNSDSLRSKLHPPLFTHTNHRTPPNTLPVPPLPHTTTASPLPLNPAFPCNQTGEPKTTDDSNHLR